MNHYIITIHNTGDLLNNTLQGVECSAQNGSIIVPVLDGCSDNSKEIVLKFKKSSSHDVRIVETPNLHEIGSINSGLRALREDGGIFILQDDVVLKSNRTEAFIESIASTAPNVGLVSMRMGGEIAATSFAKAFWQLLYTKGQIRGRILSDMITVQSCFDELGVRCNKIMTEWTYEEVKCCIKSPIWISPQLRRNEKFLDENLMPYCYDDLDLSIRAIRNGLVNFVAAIPYASAPTWGGTRKPSSTFKSEIQRIGARNRRYLYNKHYSWIADANVVKNDNLLGSLFKN